jgi:hypothetical protein
MEDRAKQLDEDERKNTESGKAFWETHLDHVELLNDFVHAELGGSPIFTDPMTRELLGFEALVYAHQYLSLSIVSVVRLTGLDKPSEQAQAAFAPIHDTGMQELRRLVKDPPSARLTRSAPVARRT